MAYIWLNKGKMVSKWKNGPEVDKFANLFIYRSEPSIVPLIFELKQNEN